MLQPADLLLLDEPTNDLDIPTLEILEESLLEYKGALVLVTHDRYLLDRVSTVVLGLDGQGSAETFADYSQWEEWQAEQTKPEDKTRSTGSERTNGKSGVAKKKLSYLEAREHSSIEERIAKAEQLRDAKRDALEDPAIASDANRLVSAHEELEQAQEELDAMYTRWAELEAKLS
jgi:ATP-binding cassette subfamily F protein uup